jgi:YidC/Oxa1 family membrane protein insertase
LTAAPAAGVAAMLERVGRVRVTEGTARDLDDDRRAAAPLGSGEWAGARNRFWALLVRPDGAGALERRSDPRITLRSEGPSWRYTFFSGPVESQALAHADPALKGLLFSGLWSPLRALSFALLALLRGLSAVVPDPGVAIIALAFSVRILLLPLTILAERLQEQVDATRTRLQPGIDAIRASHRGEEQARRTWALYRAEGVHPLYTLKSLLGVAIQLPVFIAVFDMLAEDFDLYRASFLWIADLSQPDALLPLPLCVPFFGCHVNLLPFLMSAISLTALLRFRSPVLAPSLERRQRRTLMGITLAFFLLFYTFPAGMVLYWTSTNAFQLVKQELMRPRQRRA